MSYSSCLSAPSLDSFPIPVLVHTSKVLSSGLHRSARHEALFVILRDVILAAQHGGAPRPPQMVARLSDFAKRRHELGTDGPADDEADGEIKEYFSRTESVPKDGKWGLSKTGTQT